MIPKDYITEWRTLAGKRADRRFAADRIQILDAEGNVLFMTKICPPGRLRSR